MPEPLRFLTYQHALPVIGDSIYCVGGDAASGDSDAVHIYNTRTNTWSVGPALPTPDSGGACMAYDGDIYLFGGIRDR